MEHLFDKSWLDFLGEDKLLKLLLEVNKELKEQRQIENILPLAGSEYMFKAFRLTKCDEVRVVVLGMDPYHDGSFNGVAFGNGKENEKIKHVSPSLRNILKEVERSYGSSDIDTSLYSWARQGVLLINTAHTVIRGIPGSHLDLWMDFTNFIISNLNRKDDIVWLLWGSKAQNYEKLITNESHHILKAGHPSPLNRVNPFVESDIFLKCDKVIKGDPITWSLPF
jgi:uracil-DNA glycosylase